MGKLYDKLEEYGKSDFYPYHMPGHKRRASVGLPEELARLDITEIEGFDNLHQAEGILRELQERASKLYGAEETFYLVNGSTCGILSAISAALPLGGHILMARNSHKSAYHAAYLRTLTISYLYPDLLSEYDIAEAVAPEQVRKALDDKPDIGAVFVVSPTYEGRIADIKAIAGIVHEKGIPLIVDEAHGAHLGLAEGFAENSCRLGADIVIHSVHKTLPAMTQTALLHVNGDRINRTKLERFLHIYQSSSPSYVLMGSIDNALQLVENQGTELFKNFRERFLKLLENLQVCRHLQFIPFQEGRQDIGKLVISAKKTGLSGQQIYDMLLQEYHLQLEMAAGSYCLAMFTIGDTPEAYERMEKALLEIDRKIGEGNVQELCRADNLDMVDVGCKDIVGPENRNVDVANSLCTATQIISEQKPQCRKPIPLSRAWDMPYERVPLRDAVGRRVAEFVNLYPPGIPLLVPGEVLQAQQYEMLLEYFAQGLTVQGAEKEMPHFIKVLTDKGL